MKWPSLLFCLGWAAPLGLLCATLLGSPEGAAPSALRSTVEPAAGQLLVIASGELNGHLTPCGCSKPMLGGLLRRATYLSKLDSPPELRVPSGRGGRTPPEPGVGERTVRLENGDLTEALGRQDELKAETSVEMLDQMKYDAINLGEKDFRLGTPFLQALRLRFKGAFLCANARDEKGAPLFQEQIVLKRTVGGRAVRVAVIGMISEQFGNAIHTLSPEVSIEAPDAALKRLMPLAAAQSEVRILMYHGSKAEAEALAQQFEGLQLVICAHEGDVPSVVQQVRACGLLSGGEDGKRLAAVRMDQTKGWRATSEEVVLAPNFGDDKDAIQINKSYLLRVTAEGLLDKTPRTPTADGAAYAGSRACSGCHATAATVWQASRHAHALATLQHVSEDMDPECVKCHVVGLERQTGFASHEKTPDLENVGCESCHGPGSKHVADPKVSFGKAGTASCDQCHIVQHSPHFEFQSYWSKIKHGLQ